MATHPKGTRARVLFSSVFGPYAQDDEFGSRKINPMELYHNQVTREQGPFSLRMFHRSWGILMIQQNISAPTTVLDFPTREAFAEELRANQYDIVGITSIIVNVGKVREMCRMVRELSPNSTIVVGGHVAALPDIESLVDADHIVKGDGISWMRRFLGEDDTAPIRHPEIVSGFGTRSLGMKLPVTKGTTAATIIPSVGCPMGCNFCTTSAFFGGKGKYLNFYDTGDELFDVMSEMERKLDVKSFFMMDENFLLHKRRAMELLEFMKAENKAWSLYVFSSANAISQYTMRELVELGVSWIWMGLESPQSSYIKLKGADTIALTRELRSHGIKLLGSTIVGLEHHTPENIEAEIEHAVAHDTDFHQFMLYTPVPGTPLFFEMKEQGRMLPDVEPGRHPRPARLQLPARRDLPGGLQALARLRLPPRFRAQRPEHLSHLPHHARMAGAATARTPTRASAPVSPARPAPSATAIPPPSGRWSITCARAMLPPPPRSGTLRQEIGREFGWFSRLVTSVVGPVLLWTTRREERRLAAGHTYEPPTIIERRNWSMPDPLDAEIRR